tara:strand:+ start:132 stop:857 length:726 start_codon:yes stop_codon:yes gene_type:complete
MDRIFQNYDDNFLPNQNFVFLKKFIYINEKEERYCESEELSIDCQYEEYSTGSAIAIDHDKNTLRILTVFHVCGEETMEALSLISKKENGEYSYPNFKIKAYFYGLEYDAHIVDYDMDNDICLLEIESEFAYKVKKINIASEKPKLGETVYTISAPLSMASKTTRFHFHGAFAGCDNEYLTKFDFCFFSIPAAPGSSGSGVFNKYGELVSLISITLAPFPEISAGPRQYYIKKLLNSNSSY